MEYSVNKSFGLYTLCSECNYPCLLQATDRDAGNFSAVQYRISSGNDGGFFKIDESTGFITTATNFKGKKGERFVIKVSAYDNHGIAPTNEAQGEATAQVIPCCF